MSTQGRFRVVTAPNDVFLGTDVGDFAISSTNGVFLGALPAGVSGAAHIKLDEEGVVANEPISALAGVAGDVRTGSITPLVSGAGIQVSSGAGTLRLDAVVVDGDAVSCRDLTVDSVSGVSNVSTAALTLPSSTLSCPAGMTAVRLAPAAPLLDVALSDGSPATLRVTNLAVQNLAGAVRVQGALRVDADADVGTTLRVRGAATVDGTATVQGAILALGTGSAATLTVSAPYLAVSALTQVPALRFGAGTVLDNNAWGSRQAARATFAGLPAFYEADGVVLVGPVPATTPVAVRHIGGAVASVYVDNGAMTRAAPTVAGPCTLVNTSDAALKATAGVSARGDWELDAQVAAPSIRLLGSPGAASVEVRLTAPAAGLTSDKRVVAPSFRVADSADLTPIAGGGAHVSTRVNVPQVLLRNATDASTVATHQTDFDGAARVVAPYLRLQGPGDQVQLQPTAGGTRVQPGVLDLAYNTTQATLAHLRVDAQADGLHLRTPRVFLEENSAAALSSDSATGTLTLNGLPTLSLNGLVSVAASSAAGKATAGVLADRLEVGTAVKATLTPEAGGALLGPGADVTLRASTRIGLQAAGTVGLVIRRPDSAWARFEFEAGSRGELRVNGRDIGLTPYDALAGSASVTAPDTNAWYTFRTAASATAFRARLYNGAEPQLVRTSAAPFVLPGFTDSLYHGTASTTYIAANGGTAAFTGAWLDMKFPKALSLKRWQTVLTNANQVDRRPAVWRLFARNGEPSGGVSASVTDWVLLLNGGVAETTDPADKELSVYDCFRLAVSIVTSGDEVRLAALNLWGVDAAPTVIPQNSFTGQHWTVPAAGADASEFLPGMVVVASGQHDSVNWGGFKARGGASALRLDSALPRVSLTSVAGDRRAFGVVDSWRLNAWVRFDDRRLVVNSLGEGALLVCSSNGPIANGDLLRTSSVRGHCERQGSDAVLSSTVAKATMDCDFAPAAVPAMRIVVDDYGQPALDAAGLVVWEPTGETEPAYECVRLLSQGVSAATISCVYMCG